MRADARAVDGALWEPLLVEGLAQTAAILNARHDDAGDERVQRGMLVGVRRFTVHRAPRVGERIAFRVDLVRRLAPVTLMQGTARVGAEIVAAGELKFWVEAPA